jgi:hypothetical protein
MTYLLMPSTPWRMFTAAASWHLTSQQQARRNALVCTTALAQQRRERLDVEEYLTARDAAAAATRLADGHPA